MNRMRASVLAALASWVVATPAAAAVNCGRDCKIHSAGEGTTIVPPDALFSQFQRYGQYFAYSAANLYPVAGGGVVAYSSAFSFKVGASSTATLYIGEDGFVAFGQSPASGGFVATSDLARLGTPLIAPFYANLDSRSQTAATSGYSGVVIQQGIADPFADAGAFSLTDAKPALQVTWYGFDVGGTAAAPGMPVYTQLLLIDEGGGDFDFRIRAGAPGSGVPNSPSGGIGGFVFGNANYQYSTPYNSSSAGLFAVRGGEIVEANSIFGAVPEPATWVMMVVGFGLAGVASRRRMRSRSGDGIERLSGDALA